MKQIKIFDTTLRDGEQAPGCSMHIDEKLEVALALERLGVDIIEAGFAVSSKGDFESVKQIANLLKDCKVASLARSVTKDIDAAYEALKGAVSPRIHLFLATSPIHMQYKLRMSEDTVLSHIDTSVRYAKKLMSDIEFSCEDATRSERPFLVKAIETAIKAGATVINVPDTVGYITPAEMYDLISFLKENVKGIEKVDLSVHCHNDLGLAVANSLMAVKAGATQVEGSINGIGERAGNTALEELIMALNVKKNVYNATTRIDTRKIYPTSKLLYNVIGFYAPINKPIVGENAFLHEAGIHQHGVLANRETYEIMTPESIGIPKRDMVFGKHSGKHAIQKRLQELGHELTAEELEEFFEKFKALADKKKVINDFDLEALLHHSDKEIDLQAYRLVRFTVNTGNYITTNAVVKLARGEEEFEEVAIGDGPIDAAYNAIDKIIKVGAHSLEDYSIRSITEGNDALGEVVVRIKLGEETVTGRGLSTDIIESSLMAYINGLNKLQTIPR